MFSDEYMLNNRPVNNKLELLKSLFIMRDTMHEVTKLLKDATDTKSIAYDKLRNLREKLDWETERQNMADENSVNCALILDALDKFVALINKDSHLLSHLLTADDKKNFRKPFIKESEYVELKKDSFVFPSTQEDKFFHINFKNGWREIPLMNLISAMGMGNDNDIPAIKKCLKKLAEENTWQLRDILFKEYQILYLKSAPFGFLKSGKAGNYELELKEMKKLLTESIKQGSYYESLVCGNASTKNSRISELEERYTEFLSSYEAISKHYDSVKKLYNNTCKIVMEEYLPLVPPKYVTDCNALTHFIFYLYNDQVAAMPECISLYEKNRINNVQEPDLNIDLVRKNVLAAVKNSNLQSESTPSIQLYSVLEEIAASKEARKQIMKKSY